MSRAYFNNEGVMTVLYVYTAEGRPSVERYYPVGDQPPHIVIGGYKLVRDMAAEVAHGFFNWVSGR